MATLYVSEFRAQILNGVPVAVQPAQREQTVAIGGGASSSPFGPNTDLVRLHCDAICSFRFGGAAATTSNARMAANQTEYFVVNPGDVVSVIANA